MRGSWSCPCRQGHSQPYQGDRHKLVVVYKRRVRGKKMASVSGGGCGKLPPQPPTPKEILFFLLIQGYNHWIKHSRNRTEGCATFLKHFFLLDRVTMFCAWHGSKSLPPEHFLKRDLSNVFLRPLEKSLCLLKTSGEDNLKKKWQ